MPPCCDHDAPQFRSCPPSHPLNLPPTRPAGKAPQLQLSDDRLSVTGHKGFRTVRASHGAYKGTWYCEARVNHLGKSGHVRLGWCTRRAELQAPVGFDEHGFCYRDLEGSRVHKGLREAYGEAYGEGDVVSSRGPVVQHLEVQCRTRGGGTAGTMKRRGEGGRGDGQAGGHAVGSGKRSYRRAEVRAGHPTST